MVRDYYCLPIVFSKLIHYTEDSGNERNILLTKITAAQNEVALRYHRVRGLYFLAVIFATTIVVITILICLNTSILIRTTILSP